MAREKSKFTYPKCPYCKAEYRASALNDHTLSELAIRGWNREAKTKCEKCGKEFIVSVHISYYGRKIK